MGNDLDRYRDAERRLWQRVGLTPTERFLDLAGGERVRVQETGDGPPVLFIHGAMNAGTSWFELMAAMPEFRCIALDRPGCGLSDPIVGGPISDVDGVSAYADRLLGEVIDALGVPRLSVVGTSYGGFFTLRGAAAHIDKVERLVTMSWSLGAPMEKVAFSMRMAAIPGMKRMMPKLPITRGVVKTLFRQIGLERAIETGTFDDEMLDWAVAVLKHTDTMANDLGSSPDTVTFFGGLNEQLLLTDELLSRVTVPALLLWGDEDPNGGRSVAEAFAPRLPDAELVMIPEAGHAPWIDELTLCASRTRAFLASTG